MSGREPRNVVSVTGRITADFMFSHRLGRERFFLTYLSVPRLSGKEDILPVLLSDKLIDTERDYKDALVEVDGQFRSYRRNDYYHNMLSLTIFASEICVFEDDGNVALSNDIYLSGTTCRPTVFRRTPQGRAIADVYISVRRMQGRNFDYIPCIAWGHNAKLLSDVPASSRISIWGRIESREYTKKVEDAEAVIRRVCEVSIKRFELVEDERGKQPTVDNCDVTC